MYQVSRSSHYHCRHTSIIPINQIKCCVHLILKFGRVMHTTWTTDDVLKLCKTFYVNCYFRHLDLLRSLYLDVQCYNLPIKIPAILLWPHLGYYILLRLSITDSGLYNLHTCTRILCSQCGTMRMLQSTTASTVVN